MALGPVGVCLLAVVALAGVLRLAWVLSLAGVLRLAWVLYAKTEPLWYFDPWQYDRLAVFLAEGHGYVNEAGQAQRLLPARLMRPSLVLSTGWLATGPWPARR